MKKIFDWRLMVTLLATFAVYMYVVAPMLAPKTNGTNGTNGNGSGARRK
jgi:hypothetical protein